MAYTIEYLDKVVKKDIPALSSAAKQRIKDTIEQRLTTDPLHYGKPLRYGRFGQRSLRVGEYRIIYVIDHDAAIVTIVAIGHRRNIYN